MRNSIRGITLNYVKRNRKDKYLKFQYIDNYSSEWENYLQPYERQEGIELAKKSLKRAQSTSCSIERKKAESEVFIMMLEAKCETPLTFPPNKETDKPIFYNAYQIKSCNDVENNNDNEAIFGARECGTIFTDTQIFQIFSANQRSIEIVSLRESLYRQKTHKIADEILGRDIEEDNEKNAIILMDEVSFEEFFKSTNKKKNMLQSKMFEKMYLLPKSREGIGILFLLIKSGYEDLVDQIYIGHGEQNYTVVTDDITRKNGKYVYTLNALKPDINRIDSFYSNYKLGQDKSDYVLHCYEYAQAELSELFPKATIITHTPEEVLEDMIAYLS